MIKVGPLTRRACGVIKMPKGGSSRGVMEDALLDRHGFLPREVVER